MRRLPLPREDPVEVFRMCTSRVRDPDLKARLKSVEGRVAAASEAFVVAAAQALLHTVGQHAGMGGIVSSDEMSAVYTQRMAAKGSPGRAVYDKLLAAPTFGRCPLCGQRTVTTLDHHLPKTQYSSLAVVPANLVPACSECNKNKRELVPTCPEDHGLHPYFYALDEQCWLVATVVHMTPPALIFSCSPPTGWDEVTKKRLKNHFRVFKLAELYASHAGEELVNIRGFLRSTYARAGAQGVREYLVDAGDSRRAAEPNSWQSATYAALQASDWYCEGGFAF